MAPRIPLERVRAFVLTRQGLAGPGLPDVRAATQRCGGVYSSAPSCYLSYAARVPGFRLPDLDRALFTDRSLVRMRCFHEMVYIVRSEDAGWIAAAADAGGQGATRRLLKMSGLTRDGYEALAARIEAAITGQAPATTAAIRKLLRGSDAESAEVLRYAMALMGRQNRIVRAEVRGSWTSDSYAYARWSDWFGGPIDRPDPAAARVRAARYYLAALGPATVADLKWWVGWTVRETKAALSALGDEVTDVVLTGEGIPDAPALALADRLDELTRADPTSAAGVRLLPYWDAYAMGYTVAARQRVVPDPDRPRIYDSRGNGTSALLVDGVAAGVWEFDHEPGGPVTVRVAPFARAVAARHGPAIEEAAQRLATALGAAELCLETAPATGPLDEGARNAFLAPIRLG